MHGNGDNEVKEHSRGTSFQDPAHFLPILGNARPISSVNLGKHPRSKRVLSLLMT